MSARPDGRASTAEYFSPRGGATEFVVREIGDARKEILVQVHPFTAAPLAEALVEAHRRGVNIAVILDGSQRSEGHGFKDLLDETGIPTCVDDKHPGGINRIMIIDGRTVITGSVHSMKAKDEESAENLLVIRGDAVLLMRYRERFEEHRRHSLSCASDSFEAHGDAGP